MNEGWNDNLFRFLKSVLKKEEGLQEDWNTPPDHVFEGAMSQIASNKKGPKSKNRFILLLLLGIFFIGSLSILGYHRIYKINKKVDNLEITLNELKAENKALKDKNENKTIHEESDQIDVVAATSKNEKVRHPNISFNNMAEPKQSNSAKIANSEIFNSSVISTFQIPTTQQSAIQKFNLIDKSETTIGGKSIPTIIAPKLLESISLHILHDFIIQNPGIIATSHESENARKKRGLALNVLAHHNLSKFTMTHSEEDMPVLSGYDKFYSGYGVGAYLDMPLSKKWSLVFGLGYVSLGNQSEYRNQMIYDEGNEVLDQNGDMIYKDNMTIQTPLGYYEKVTDFSTDILHGSNGDHIFNETGIVQELNIINFTLGSRYQIARSGKFDFLIGMYVEAGLISKSSTDMYSMVFMEDEHVMDFETKSSKMEMIANKYYTVAPEFLTKFHLKSNIDLIFSTQFKHSVSSLRNSLDISDPKTYFQQMNFGLGLSYQFK